MKTKTHLLTAFVLSALTASFILLASGCWFVLGCTQIDCADQASIWITGLPIGQAYEIELETPEAIIQCAIAPDGEMRITCDSYLYYDSYMDEARLSIPGTPDRVAITVRQNGAVLAQEEVIPDYVESAPNGETCGPICHQASIVVAL
jgi:hypothetical protein